MLALIGAGYTLQKFKSIYPAYDFYETHRDNLLATEDHVKGDLSFLDKVQGLVFSLPPSKSALNLVRNLNFEGKAILLSSIGVYSKEEAVINETGAIGISERSQLIRQIEIEFLKLPEAVVLRLGGLFDENRHPVKYIIKNNSHPEAQELVNFVHIDDVCESIHFMLKNRGEHKVYNIVDQNHPTKEEYYTKIASRLNLEPIKFSKNPVVKSQIDSSRIISEFSTNSDFLNKVR
ncbi:MAG: hypothetical protein CME65_12935 [Halobacteriovoraceae bacterium]|nr:hypothetical protein [Halobacteriovoraceae bacterium]|tara:strand:+ start:7746 stop:8447 length:702 start_codon:yes stop_codon:yes gene_type:complete